MRLQKHHAHQALDEKSMKAKAAILIMIHCKENTGYAIATLEEVFRQAALTAGFENARIFWSFNGLIDSNDAQKLDCNYHSPNASKLISFVRENKISTVIAFDLGCPARVIKLLRQAGVAHIVSYWGASMSSINTGIKLLVKKMEYSLRRHKPDAFIFESEAMRNTATNGRGVPESKTHVVYLGVDTDKFSPLSGQDFYTHIQFGIPKNRKIIFYSGHMEERKGVRVIINAALILAKKNQLQDIHFVLCGNKNDEAKTYSDMLIDSAAEQHVTFAGYRTDIPLLMRSSNIGVIASTGWDSFTMSSVEMMASGLPMIVSNLQGLSETIEPNHNGYLIEPGNSEELGARIYELTNNAKLCSAFAINSRNRALTLFTKDRQIQKIADLLCQP